MVLSFYIAAVQYFAENMFTYMRLCQHQLSNPGACDTWSHNFQGGFTIDTDN